MKKLTVIAIKTHFPIDLRKFIFQHLMWFRTSIVKAIRYRKKGNVTATRKISSMYK